MSDNNKPQNNLAWFNYTIQAQKDTSKDGLKKLLSLDKKNKNPFKFLKIEADASFSKVPWETGPTSSSDIPEINNSTESTSSALNKALEKYKNTFNKSNKAVFYSKLKYADTSIEASDSKYYYNGEYDSSSKSYKFNDNAFTLAKAKKDTDTSSEIENKEFFKKGKQDLFKDSKAKIDGIENSNITDVLPLKWLNGNKNFLKKRVLTESTFLHELYAQSLTNLINLLKGYNKLSTETTGTYYIKDDEKYQQISYDNNSSNSSEPSTDYGRYIQSLFDVEYSEWRSLINKINNYSSTKDDPSDDDEFQNVAIGKNFTTLKEIFNYEASDELKTVKDNILEIYSSSKNLYNFIQNLQKATVVFTSLKKINKEWGITTNSVVYAGPVYYSAAFLSKLYSEFINEDNKHPYQTQCYNIIKEYEKTMNKEYIKKLDGSKSLIKAFKSYCLKNAYGIIYGKNMHGVQSNTTSLSTIPILKVVTNYGESGVATEKLEVLEDAFSITAESSKQYIYYDNNGSKEEIKKANTYSTFINTDYEFLGLEDIQKALKEGYENAKQAFINLAEENNNICYYNTSDLTSLSYPDFSVIKTLIKSNTAAKTVQDDFSLEDKDFEKSIITCSNDVTDYIDKLSTAINALIEVYYRDNIIANFEKYYNESNDQGSCSGEIIYPKENDDKLFYCYGLGNEDEKTKKSASNCICYNDASNTSQTVLEAKRFPASRSDYDDDEEDHGVIYREYVNKKAASDAAVKLANATVLADANNLVKLSS